MNKNNFYNIFWEILLSKKIDKVFGLPGSPIDNLLSNKPNEINWINIGNELSNGFVSQIYGQFINNVGYLIVSVGPGIATAISALEHAIYEGNPLVIVTPVLSNLKEGAFQNWNIKKISKSLTKNVFHINNENNIVSNIIDSYETAKRYNTGVILLFETNIYTLKKHKIPSINIINNEILDYKKKEIKLSNLIKIIENINSTNLLLVIGRLKINDYKSLFAFIKNNNLPFVTTSKGRFFKKNIGIDCGRIGCYGKHSANYAIYNATHLLLLGNISGLLNNPFKKKFTIIYTENKIIYSLCYNKEHSFKTNNLYELNNLSDILDKLNIKINKEWINKLKISNSILKVDLQCITKLETYIYLAWKIYKSNNLKIPITSGVGNHWYGICKYMDVEEYNSFESSTVWASIGIGISNAIAIYYATGKHVWTFEGDGGLLFGSTDLLYLVNNKHLPITVTIYVNNLYGAIFEDYELRFDKINEVINVPNIEILHKLPNCFKFNNQEKYYEYLNNNPISNEVRFIIIYIPNSKDNEIYEINLDKEYENNLKNDIFNDILNTKMIL